MNLEQLPYKPGDIVRDRKTDVDYVIESMAGFSLVGGLSIVGIGLLKDVVNKWNANSLDEMTDGKIIIRKGIDKMSPAEVRQGFRLRINELLNYDSELMENLVSSENAGLRDLLLYGVALEIDEPTKAVSRGIINLAKSIVTLTGKVPDPAAIKKILQEGLEGGNLGSVTEDALDAFSKNLTEYAKAIGIKAKTQQYLTDESALRSLLVGADGALGGGDAFTLSRGFRPLFASSEGNRTLSGVIKSILGSKSIYDPNGSLDKIIFGGPVNLSPLERVREMSKKMFLSYSGRGELSQTTTNFLLDDKLLKTAVNILTDNKSISKKTANYKNANLLINALANWLVSDKHNGQAKNAIMATASNLMLNSASPYQSSNIQKMQQIRRLIYADRSKQNLIVQNYSEQYTRRSGIVTKTRPLQAFRLMDVLEIDKAVKNVKSARFAVSKDAFLTSVLGRTKIKINNVEGRLNEENVLRELQAIDKSTDPYLIMSSNQYNAIKQHIKMSPNEPLDLTTLIREQNALKKSLTYRTAQELSNVMVDVQNGTGTEAVVPLRAPKGKFDPFLYYTQKLEDGTTKEFLTADTETILRVLESHDNTSDDVAILYRGFGRPSASKLKRAITAAESQFGERLDLDYKENPTISNIRSLFARVQRSEFSTSSAINVKDVQGGGKVVANAVKSQSLFNLKSILTRGKFTSTQMNDAFKAGYETGKLAIARIKGKTGIGSMTVLGSNVNADIPTQIKRAEQYFAGKGIILDIESYRDIKTNLTRTTQVSFGNQSTPTMFSLVNRDFDARNPAKQAQALFSLAKELEGRLKSGIEVVGTAGDTDFRTLIRHAESLIEKYPQRKELIDQLTYSTKIFKDIQENKLFDTQIVYSFLEGNKGVSNQAFFTDKYLKRPQQHTAKQDVIDLIEILRETRGDFETNLKKFQFLNEKDLEKGVFILENDTLAPNIPRRIKKILGVSSIIGSSADLEGGAPTEKHFLKYMLYDVKKTANGDVLVPLNRVGADEYESMQMMSLSLQKNSHIFTEDQLNQVVNKETGETLSQSYSRSREDSVERLIRSHSFGSLTRYDATGMFENDMGIYSAYNLEMDYRLQEVFPSVNQKFEQIQEKITGGAKRELTEREQLAAMDALDSQLDDIIKANFSDMHPAEGQTEALLSAEDLKMRITSALDNERLTAREIVDHTSQFRRALASPARKSLRSAARKALGVKNKLGKINQSSTLYQLKAILYEEQAAANMQKVIDRAPTLKDHLVETAPRLNLRLGNQRVSMQNMTTQMDANAFVKSTRNLAAEVMIAPDKEENKKVLAPILKKLKISENDYLEHLEQFREARGINAESLEQYKKDIQSLGFLGETGEFKELNQVRNAIMHEHIASAPSEGLNAKIENLMALKKIEKDSVAKRQIEEQIKMAKRMLRRLEMVGNKTSNKNPNVRSAKANSEERVFGRAQQVSSIFQKEAKEDSKTFARLMQDRYLKAPSIDSLTAQEVANIDDQVIGAPDGEGLYGTLTRQLDADRYGTTAEEVIAGVMHQSKLEPKKLFSFDYKRRPGQILRSITRMHKQGVSLSSLLQNFNANRSTYKTHEIIANAKVAAAKANALVSGPEKQAAELTIRNLKGPLFSASKAFSKVSVPLLALGGIAGFLAAKEPNTGETFSQGKLSDQLSQKFTGDEIAVSKYSEIPGNPDMQQTWYGSTSPFQLDITFKGFVSDRITHQNLQREVFNILNSNMEIRKTNGEIEDNRNRTHKVAAIEALRRNI